MTFTVSDSDTPSEDELVRLYDSVGWSAYTKYRSALVAGVRGSLRVVTARANGTLIGLARVVGDGATIAYLQDILVDPDFQGCGVGRRLIEAAFEPFSHVRQHVLLTDDEPAQRAFYEAVGFTEIRDQKWPMRAFVRLQS